MKRWPCLIVFLFLFAFSPLSGQQSTQLAETNVAATLDLSMGPRGPSGFEVLSKTSPLELGDYPFRILAGIRNKWFPQLAELEGSAAWKPGTTIIELELNQNGSLARMTTVGSAGSVSLDSAASEAISSTAPFPKLPEAYHQKTLRLRYRFGYDQPDNPGAPVCSGPQMGAHPSDYVVHKAGNGIAPPRLTNSPDPEYSGQARSMKYESKVVLAGTVDPEGAFTDLCTLVPAGMGLDVNAIDAVRRWRFKPATLNGEPAAVRINVEVDFRLY
jgi:TonB family protein